MSELSPEAVQYQQAQQAEYSAWVAKEPIDIGGARAFNVGDPVPKGHVDRGVVDKSQVERPPKAETPAESPVNPKGEKA